MATIALRGSGLLRAPRLKSASSQQRQQNQIWFNCTLYNDVVATLYNDVLATLATQKKFIYSGLQWVFLLASLENSTGVFYDWCANTVQREGREHAVDRNSNRQFLYGELLTTSPKKGHLSSQSISSASLFIRAGVYVSENNAVLLRREPWLSHITMAIHRTIGGQVITHETSETSDTLDP